MKDNFRVESQFIKDFYINYFLNDVMVQCRKTQMWMSVYIITWMSNIIRGFKNYMQSHISQFLWFGNGVSKTYYR